MFLNSSSQMACYTTSRGLPECIPSTKCCFAQILPSWMCHQFSFSLDWFPALSGFLLVLIASPLAILSCPIPTHPVERPYLSRMLWRVCNLFARLPLANSSFGRRTLGCSIPRLPTHKFKNWEQGNTAWSSPGALCNKPIRKRVKSLSSCATHSGRILDFPAALWNFKERLGLERSIEI